MNIKREIERFGKICMKTQVDLKGYLQSFLASNGYKVIVGDGYVYAKGTLPYLVTAHMDTVHKVQCERYTIHKYKGKHRIQSPVGIGGDDRCGIYMIVRMVLDGYRPSILFCEDEEIGSIGAGKFCKTKYVRDLEKLNYLIELDRANARDAVFYYCDNKDFRDFILKNTGYDFAEGTWTDIVELSDECGVASVNFSCGYYKAHTTSEYVLFEEMQNTIYIVEKLLRMDNVQQYEFIEAPDRYITNNRYFLSDNYYDRYGYTYGYGYGYEEEEDKEVINGMEISFFDPVTSKLLSEVVPGSTELECLGTFFKWFPDVCFNDVQDWLYV